MNAKKEALKLVDSFKDIEIDDGQMNECGIFMDYGARKKCALIHLEGVVNALIFASAFAYTNEGGEVKEIREQIELFEEMKKEIKVYD